MAWWTRRSGGGRAEAAAGILLIAAGCAAAVPPRDPVAAAVARAGCSEEDAPALLIEIADPRGTIAVEVAGMPRATMASRTVPLVPLRRPRAGGGDVARASMRIDGGAPSYLAGSVTLDRVAPGSGVTGRYDLRGARGTAIAGRFAARWAAGEARCG